LRGEAQVNAEPDRRVEPAIVVLGPLPPPFHGAANVTRTVCDRMLAAGADVSIVDTSASAARSRIRYTFRRIAVHIRCLRVIGRNRRRPDRWLYVGGAGGLGLWYQAVVIAAAVAMKYRIAFHHHSYAYLTRRSLAMRLICGVGCARLEHVVLCEGMRARLVTLYPMAKRTFTCSNSAWLGNLAGEPIRQDHGREWIELGHVSSLSRAKGLEELLETLRRLRSSGYPARMHLVGHPASLEDQRTLKSAETEFGEALVAHGRLDRGGVERCLRLLDAFLFPSRTRDEAEPLAVLEALRAGVPVLAFDVGCLASLLPATDLVPTSSSFPDHAMRWFANLNAGQPTRKAAVDRYSRLADEAAPDGDTLISRMTSPTQL
jgi:glycosyltransferase involved in cell wall biosynthesis